MPAHPQITDATLFRRLFETHRQKVYNQALRMTRSRWHAEEIVQEVFIRVWVHRDQVSKIKDMKSWLFIITKRIVFDYTHKLTRERDFLATCKRNALSTNDDGLLAIKCRKLLREAEQQLTPRQKQVYHLRLIRGMNQKEIARQLKISEFTATYHIKEAAATVKNHVLMRLEIVA